MSQSDSPFPSHFSKTDVAAVHQLLAIANNECKAYDGNWQAPWLKTALLSPTWTLDEPNKRSQRGENSRPANKLSWEIDLHNGTKLTDIANARMFEAVAKSCFLLRELSNRKTGNLTLLNFQYSLLVFTRWLYLHETRYQPTSYAFSRIDSSSILEFLRLAGEGGTPWILGYPHSLLEFWYASATGSKLPREVLSDLFAIPDYVRIPVIDWLSRNMYFRSPNGDRAGYLDRRVIATTMGWDVHLIKMHSTFSTFLRQFEPDVTSNLLIGREFRREFPSHKTLTHDAARDRKVGSASEKHWATIRTLLSLRPHLPEFIPDTTNINQGELGRYARAHFQPGSHTPWIPLKLALLYTNEALRWVIKYGDDIVDLYLRTVRELRERNLLGGAPGRMWQLVEKRREAANAIAKPDSLKLLCIDGWQSKLCVRRAYSEFRTAPGLNDVLAVLVGAVTVLFSFLKPMRETEEQDLRRDAIRFKDKDGYWIYQSLAKASIAGQRPSIERPIPRVVARGLSLIDRISEGLRELEGLPTGKETDLLFFLPDRDATDDLSLHAMTAPRMYGYIDRFCDYVNTANDEYGRRWYLRIHEARKSFLITFFWCFKFASLEASRWMAGHSDARDIYQYIEANFPGQELPQIEAEYCAQQLWLFDTGRPTEANNVPLIYKAVCTHFNVSEISLIEELELKAWLEIAFERKTYQIEPYTIRSADGSIATDICFRIVSEP